MKRHLVNIACILVYLIIVAGVIAVILKAAEVI